MNREQANALAKRVKKLSKFITRRMMKYGDMRSCECGHEGEMARSEQFSARSVVDFENMIIDLACDAAEGKL